MEELEEVKNAIQICVNFEKKQEIKIINPKGRAAFVQMWNQYEKQNRVKNFVKDTVRDELKPMQNVLTAIAEKLEIDVFAVSVNPEKVEEAEDAIDNGKIKQTEWKRITKSDELNVYQYKNHVINVIVDATGKKMANIDDGQYVKIKTNEDLEKLKKQVEDMPNGAKEQ